MAEWTCLLELDTNRKKTAGSEKALGDAIRNGADLRIYTEFIHNEHVDVTSENAERIKEVAEFGVTYLLQDFWVAGIMNLRQPIELPDSFGRRSSMSFFMYNQDGNQGIARPYLDGVSTINEPGPSDIGGPPNMPKYHAQEDWDAQTNAPSNNFIYDFDIFRFCVYDSWKEVFSHDSHGSVRSGSLDELIEAFSKGCEVKVGIQNLCSDLSDKESEKINHEVFIQVGSCYYYTDKALFIVGTHPLIRVKPGIPMQYKSRSWDFGWLMVRTDGYVIYRRCDPYTLKFEDISRQYAVRWFVR